MDIDDVQEYRFVYLSEQQRANVDNEQAFDRICWSCCGSPWVPISGCYLDSHLMIKKTTGRSRNIDKVAFEESYF